MTKLLIQILRFGNSIGLCFKQRCRTAVLPIRDYFISFGGRQFHDVGVAERTQRQESHAYRQLLLEVPGVHCNAGRPSAAVLVLLGGFMCSLLLLLLYCLRLLD